MHAFSVCHTQYTEYKIGGAAAKKIQSWQTFDVYFGNTDKIKAGEIFDAKIVFENDL